MGIFNRLSDIINSNLNALLDSAENPEKIIRLVIQEMEDTLIELRTNAARTLAEQKKLNRQLSQINTEVDDWQKKAELAISKERDDLARAALVEKNNSLNYASHLQKELDELALHITRLDEDMERLQSKLDEAKARQKAVVMRHDTVSSRLKARHQLHDERINSAMEKFEHLHQKIDHMEGKVDSYDMGRKKTLHDQFAELESEEDINRELEELKKSTKNER